MSMNWDDIMAEVEAEARREADKMDTPEARARWEAKRKAEHDKGVRNGWWTEDGTPISNETDDEDEDDEDADL